MGFFAVWAKVIMLHRSNMVKQIFDFIVGVFYFVVLLCKGSVFMLGGQEMCWFLLVLLGVKRLPKSKDGMIFVLKLVANAHKKGMNDSLFTP